jgi:hypothetical protein
MDSTSINFETLAERYGEVIAQHLMNEIERANKVSNDNDSVRETVKVRFQA